MARSINKVIVPEPRCRPEVRTTPAGQRSPASRSPARSSEGQGRQKHEKTEWVKCIAWRGTADIAQRYLRRAPSVRRGQVETRSWEDKNGGGKRYATEVIVGELVMLDPPSGNWGGQGGGAARSQGGAPDFGDDFTPATRHPRTKISFRRTIFPSKAILRDSGGSS
jgi:single-strand DNA-binding protein